MRKEVYWCTGGVHLSLLGGVGEVVRAKRWVRFRPWKGNLGKGRGAARCVCVCPGSETQGRVILVVFPPGSFAPVTEQKAHRGADGHEMQQAIIGDGVPDYASAQSVYNPKTSICPPLIAVLSMQRPHPVCLYCALNRKLARQRHVRRRRDGLEKRR